MRKVVQIDFDIADFEAFLKKRIRWFRDGGANENFLKGMIAALLCLKEYLSKEVKQ